MGNLPPSCLTECAGPSDPPGTTPLPADNRPLKSSGLTYHKKNELEIVKVSNTPQCVDKLDSSAPQMATDPSTVDDPIDPHEYTMPGKGTTIEPELKPEEISPSGSTSERGIEVQSEIEGPLIDCQDTLRVITRQQSQNTGTADSWELIHSTENIDSNGDGLTGRDISEDPTPPVLNSGDFDPLYVDTPGEGETMEEAIKEEEEEEARDVKGTLAPPSPVQEEALAALMQSPSVM